MSVKKKDLRKNTNAITDRLAIPAIETADDGLIRVLYGRLTANQEIDFFKGLAEREIEEWIVEKDVLVREELRIRGRLTSVEINALVSPSTASMREKLVARVRLGGTVKSYRDGTLYHRDYEKN